MKTCADTRSKDPNRHKRNYEMFKVGEGTKNIVWEMGLFLASTFYRRKYKTIKQ